MPDIKRRDFLKASATAVVVTSTCLCGLNGCSTFTKIGHTQEIKPEALVRKGNKLLIDLSKEPLLSRVGGAVKIKNEHVPQGIIIAHTEENAYQIASLLCTHRGVEVDYDHKNKRFECASLGSSTYTLDGQNIKGLAKKPLQKYEASVSGNVLAIRI
ncbi:MAG: Rieske 2Fe-2S domain-containing protein [Smithellaceae bacterium]|nr:Rieske 2Fe-2S domain-containing protein [Smithellaceae bacterium]